MLDRPMFFRERRARSLIDKTIKEVIKPPCEAINFMVVKSGGDMYAASLSDSLSSTESNEKARILLKAVRTLRNT